MIAKRQPSRPDAPLADQQASFLSILPRIRTHARIYFRSTKCTSKLADLIAEVVAIAWKWFVRLAEKGKNACQFASVLANYAAKAVQCGRRLCGQAKAKDVMNEHTQQKRGFAVGKLPDFSTLSDNPLQDALADNVRTPPPDAAAFRIDFPRWRRSHSNRNRRIIDDMAKGERTRDIARKFKISQPRISQLRRELHEDWLHFHGEEEVFDAAK